MLARNAHSGKGAEAALRAAQSNLPRKSKVTMETGASQISAQQVEFVAFPGIQETLQREILLLARNAVAGSSGFIGCLVLFSEQEVRLVTVITLWTGTVCLSQCSESLTRLQRLLDPYVERWLRTGNFVTFVCTQNSLDGERKHLFSRIPGPTGKAPCEREAENLKASAPLAWQTVR